MSSSSAAPSTPNAAANSNDKSQEELAASFVNSAGEYLQDTNFKTVVEWLTAEALFEMPKDPVSFIKDVVEDRLEQRDGEYEPQLADRYLHECYDEQLSQQRREQRHAKKEARSKDNSSKETNEVNSHMNERLDLLERLISASRTIATELDPMQATQSIITECCSLLNADRATVFKMESSGQFLELMVAEGAKSILVPVGKGIAGTVAENGTTINIPDAYKDDRFDASHDQKTGYRTKSILAAPIRDAQDNIIGVLQAINCLRGGNIDSNSGFNELDEEVLSILAAQAGIAIRNAELYADSRRSQNKVSAMMEVLKSLHSGLGMNSLMFTITQKSPALVDADRCTFFLLNRSSKELWAMQGDVDIRIPMDKGIAGAVATTARIVNIPDAYEDDRFNQDVDKKSGYRTKQILCVPLLTSDAAAAAATAAVTGEETVSSQSPPESRVLGVLQLINKNTTSQAFSQEDEDMVTAFLQMVAPIIENSQLFQSHARGKVKAEESGREFTGSLSVERRDQTRAPKHVEPPIIEEGDEDDEEDDDSPTRD